MIPIKDKKINKKVYIVICIAILVLAVIAIVYFGQVQGIFKIGNSARQDALPNFSIESKDGNIVLCTFRDEAGIKEIRYPNFTDVVECGGKTQVGIDFPVEPDMTYTFRVTDVNGVTRNETFIAPLAHIEVTKNDIQVDLNEFKATVTRKINGNLVATNFATVKVGDQNYVDSESTEMSEVFSSWTKFGDGNWYYNSSSKTVYNTKNSDYFTGYYLPDGQYDDIELSFNARTTDADDDVMGAMIRFNRSGNSYTSYLLVTDRHDNGGGWDNGSHNGINKIINKNLASSQLSQMTKLAGNANIRWVRNTWQSYRFIAKGNNLKAYFNNSLVAEANDTSISKGTYGFCAFSQAYTYFKDILIKTDKFYTLAELLSTITWVPQDVNIVINLNNSNESSLYDTATINTFTDNDIYYVAVSNETNKPTIEQFITDINNKGTWIDSTTYDDYTDGVANYVSTVLGAP